MNNRGIITTILIALLPWPTVFVGLYVLHSAWASFALYFCACVLSVVLARPAQIEPAKMTVRKIEWLVALVGIIGINIAATFFAGILAPDVAPAQNALLKLNATGSLGQNLALFGYFGAINPIIEELFWRRTIFLRFKQAGLSVRASSALSGFFFGAWHWLVCNLLFTPIAAIVVAVAIMLAGVALSHIYERTRSILPCIFVHSLAADIPILMILWLDVIRH